MTAKRPNRLKLLEGNPGHRAKAELESGVKLPPAVPDEPDWATVLDRRTVIVPRARKGESADERVERLRLRAERDQAAEDARAGVELAASTWARVTGILNAAGLVSELDYLALQDVCVVTARLAELERDIGRRGPMVPGRQGSVVKNPSIGAAAQYRQQFRWLSVKLGLTPADRDGMTPAAPGGQTNEGLWDWDVL